MGGLGTRPRMLKNGQIFQLILDKTGGRPTTQDGSAGMFMPSRVKAMDFTCMGRLGTGQEAWGAQPLEQKAEG